MLDIKINLAGLTELGAIDRINNKLTVINFNNPNPYLVSVPKRLNLSKFPPQVKVSHNETNNTAIVNFKDKA